MTESQVTLWESELQERMAAIWDEGYTACIDDKNYEPGYGAGNPYREETK